MNHGLGWPEQAIFFFQIRSRDRFLDQIVELKIKKTSTCPRFEVSHDVVIRFDSNFRSLAGPSIVIGCRSPRRPAVRAAVGADAGPAARRSWGDDPARLHHPAQHTETRQLEALPRLRWGFTFTSSLVRSYLISGEASLSPRLWWGPTSSRVRLHFHLVSGEVLSCLWWGPTSSRVRLHFHLVSGEVLIINIIIGIT